MINQWISEKTAKGIKLHEVIQRLTIETSYGKTMRDQLKVFRVGEEEELKAHFDYLECLIGQLNINEDGQWQIRRRLKELKDIRGSVARIQREEVLNEIELFEIKRQVKTMEALRGYLEENPLLYLSIFHLKPLMDLWSRLDPEESGLETFYLYDCYSQRLKDLRSEKQKLEELIKEDNLKRRIQVYEMIGIKININGEVLIAKGEVDKIERASQCPLLILSSEGLRSIGFKVKPSNEVKKYMEALEETKVQEEEEEFLVRQELSGEIHKHIEALNHNIESIGTLDLMLARARLAWELNGVRPHIEKSPLISFKKGRYTPVEENVRRRGEDYTPIDVHIASGVTVITGANMGGKTVALKTIALLMAMTQMGLYIPAEEGFFSLVPFLYFSTGDEQSEEEGLSTFGGEIYHLQQVLERAQEGGLILIDELARGTNPIEGYGISSAVIDYLKKLPTITVITTHFDGLGNIEDTKHLQVIGLKNVTMEDLNEALKQSDQHRGILEKYMNYQLEEVQKNGDVPKDALFIARVMGLREDIIEGAREAIMKRLGND